MAIIKPHCSREELLRVLGPNLASSKGVQKALSQAYRSHRLHVRDDGLGYLEQHIYPLVCEVFRYFKHESIVENLVVVTLLHDVLEEDGSVKEQQLLDDFGADIVELLRGLQKIRKAKQDRTQEDRHEEHLVFGARLNNSSFVCKVIKSFDRINNVECTEAKINPVKYRRFVQDTEEVYIPIASQVDPRLAERMGNGIARIKNELRVISTGRSE